MKNSKHQYEYEHEMQSAPRSGMTVVTGLLIGGLIGAGVALFNGSPLRGGNAR